MQRNFTVELLLSGCANVTTGVYLALFGTPLGLLIGFAAAGIGVVTILSVADIVPRPLRK